MERKWSSTKVEASEDFKARIDKLANPLDIAIRFALIGGSVIAISALGACSKEDQAAWQAAAEQSNAKDNLDSAWQQCADDGNSEAECDKTYGVVQHLASDQPYKTQQECENDTDVGQCRQFAIVQHGQAYPTDNSSNAWLPYWIMMHSNNRYYSAGSYDYYPRTAYNYGAAVTSPTYRAYNSMAQTSYFSEAMSSGHSVAAKAGYAPARPAMSSTARAGGFGAAGIGHGGSGS